VQSWAIETARTPERMHRLERGDGEIGRAGEDDAKRCTVSHGAGQITGVEDFSGGSMMPASIWRRSFSRRLRTILRLSSER
jgi:hypothetical protein